MRYIVFIFVIAITAYGFSVYNQQKTEKPKPNIAEITPPLLIGFYDLPVKRQDYIDGHLAYIKFNGRTQTSIDTFDAILRSEEMHANAFIKKYEQQKERAEKFLKMDVDNDKVFTRFELSENYPFRCQTICFGQGVKPSINCPAAKPGIDECTKNAIEKFLKLYDQNGDEKIDTEEMKSVITAKYDQKPYEVKRLQKYQETVKIKIRKYLELDPNQDGHLTIEELSEVTGDFFDRYDTNKDGVLSEEEGEHALRNENTPPNNMNRYRQRDQCGYMENGKKKCLKGHLAYRELSVDKTPLP